jgi:DNA-binding transcriptional regulator WhiA
MKIAQTFSEQVKDELSRYEYDGTAMKAVLSSFLTNNLSMSITKDKEV